MERTTITLPVGLFEIKGIFLKKADELNTPQSAESSGYFNQLSTTNTKSGENTHRHRK